MRVAQKLFRVGIGLPGKEKIRIQILAFNWMGALRVATKELDRYSDCQHLIDQECEYEVEEYKNSLKKEIVFRETGRVFVES